jgi:biotin carboxyl carrier protein
MEISGKKGEPAMKINVGNKTIDIDIIESHGKYQATLDGEYVDITPQFDKFSQLAGIIIDGKKYDIRLTKGKDDYKVSVFRAPFIASILHSKAEVEHTVGVHQKVIVTSPMSGLVISMHLKIGQEMVKDSQLLILEAMKMQNEIKSPVKAIVREIFVKVGQTVEKDDKLLILEPI